MHNIISLTEACNSPAQLRVMTNVCWWSCSVWFAALWYWSPCPVGTNTQGQTTDMWQCETFLCSSSCPVSSPAPPAVWRDPWSRRRSGSRPAESETQTVTFSVHVRFLPPHQLQLGCGVSSSHLCWKIRCNVIIKLPDVDRKRLQVT